jgi:hypothetical protein
MGKRKTISHDEMMLRRLKEEPAFAVEYLKAALEDTDEPKVLLIALRRITEARDGFAKIARRVLPFTASDIQSRQPAYIGQHRKKSGRVQVIAVDVIPRSGQPRPRFGVAIPELPCFAVIHLS